MNIQLCTEGCPNWAQWRVAKVRAAELDTKGKLVPKGMQIETVGHVCGEHKKKLETSDPALKFSFIGALPLGTQHSIARPNF